MSQKCIHHTVMQFNSIVFNILQESEEPLPTRRGGKDNFS
jgi:hypothetical protein